MRARLATRCCVVGAGLAGLLAAQALQANGWAVTVLEKAGRLGGRMATRRIDEDRLGQALFDYGAQFFTVRTARFARLVEQWQAAGLVVEWCQGFVAADGTVRYDGHPRYCCQSGMGALTGFLAHELDVRLHCQVEAVSYQGGQWQVYTQDDEVHRADLLILTPPVPQSIALLDGGNVQLPAPIRQALAAVTYEPCLALMALLDGPSRIPWPGAVQIFEEPVAWIADNRQKGISPEATAVTIHAGPLFSCDHWHTATEAVTGLLLEAAQDWLGAPVVTTELKRWRYSRPVELYPAPCLALSEPAPLIFAGDAFAGPKVEGAVLSGLAAADSALRLLSKS